MSAAPPEAPRRGSRILVAHRYFWPDTAPCAWILRTIADALAEAGHEVHVFASKPSYRDASGSAPASERLGRLLVRRVPVFVNEKANLATRLANAVIYPAALFLHIVKMRPDIVMASTVPPVVSAWMASLAARLIGAEFIYHVQDVHPEVSKYAGGRLGRGLPFRVLRWIDMQTLGRARAVVVLSQDMANTLLARPSAAPPIRIINNFLPESFGEGAPPLELVKAPGRTRVIFAGNLGRFQNLMLLADGVATLFDRYPELELLFLGDGTQLGELRARWGDHPQVVFGPFLPFAQAKELIRGADIGLVSLEPGITRVSYPSKMLTYLGLGLPVLALVERDSALAREIEENGLGAVPEAPVPEVIGAALERLMRGADHRANVQAYHDGETSRAAILARWRDLITELER